MLCLWHNLTHIVDQMFQHTHFPNDFCNLCQRCHHQCCLVFWYVFLDDWRVVLYVTLITILIHLIRPRYALQKYVPILLKSSIHLHIYTFFSNSIYYALLIQKSLLVGSIVWLFWNGLVRRCSIRSSLFQCFP